jgi:hypothetical protein
MEHGDVKAYVPIYGGVIGPTNYSFDFNFGSQGKFIVPGNLVNNSGTSVGSSNRRHLDGSDYGPRAVRWYASGENATELGHLGTSSTGRTASIAHGVNDGGTSVGFADKYVGGVNYGPRAVRWDASGTAAIELDNLGTNGSGSTKSVAYAVNNNGTAVGFADKYIAGTYYGPRAVRWDASGTIATELDNLGTSQNGYTFSRAYAVNDSGTAVGLAEKYVPGMDFSYRAVRWDGSGTAATELGHLGTDASGQTVVNVFDVNNSGTAVGSALKHRFMGWTERAVRWDGSGTAATELGLPPGASSWSRAFAVNDSGTAVGMAIVNGSGNNYGGPRAVRWDGSGTTATQLGDLGTDKVGFTETNAFGVNNSGIAVGTAYRYDSGILVGPSAVAWKNDAVAIDLNRFIDPNSGWVLLTSAYSISDTGWITGVGIFDPDAPGGPWFGRLFVMRIPEPSTLLLTAIGLVLGLAQRRRATHSAYPVGQWAILHIAPGVLDTRRR